MLPGRLSEIAVCLYGLRMPQSLRESLNGFVKFLIKLLALSNSNRSVKVVIRFQKLKLLLFGIF